MFIVQEDIFHTGPLIHAQTGPVIGVAQGAIPVDPENSCRDVFGDDVADLPVFNHLEVISTEYFMVMSKLSKMS